MLGGPEVPAAAEAKYDRHNPGGAIRLDEPLPGGVAQRTERQPSKLLVAGSNPAAPAPQSPAKAAESAQRALSPVRIERNLRGGAASGMSGGAPPRLPTLQKRGRPSSVRRRDMSSRHGTSWSPARSGYRCGRVSTLPQVELNAAVGGRRTCAASARPPGGRSRPGTSLSPVPGACRSARAARRFPRRIACGREAAPR